MKLPMVVKVGAYYVRVWETPNLMRDFGCCGRYIPCQRLIEIDPDMCDSMKIGTFFHELIEAMAEIFSIKALGEDHDAINILGEVLHQVAVDNPGVFK